jgi:hypothetical protein
MKRTPLKRKRPMWQNKDGSSKKRRRIKPMSEKRIAENEVRAALLMSLLLERGNRCEARCCPECSHVATDGHEKLTRGRGGSIVEAENILLVCRICHDWIHGHPLESIELGLLLPSSHGRSDRTAGRVPPDAHPDGADP